jgi:hypothetical protein
MACCHSKSVIRAIKSSRMRWVSHAASMRERKVAYEVLIGKREGNITLRRPRRRWEYNIKICLKEIG